MSKLKGDTICLAPWISIHNWPDGKTYPCCLWDSNDPVGNLNESSIEEIWNSDKMKQTRLGMLKDEKISSCSRCYEIESTGDYSYRERINRLHGKYENYLNDTNEDGSLDYMNLHLWDLRISNFCNLKCRSCGSELSSSWYQDAKALGVIPEGRKSLISISDKSKFLDDIERHYKCVDEIYFAGGEPLLMPEHYTILDRLIDLGRTDVNIRYSTNFSKLTFGKKHIFDYWKQFNNIELYISVDGVGKIGEYIRKGFDNEIFGQNVKAFRESGIPTTSFGYTVTYGVLNILHLFDMVIDFMKRDFLDYKTFNHLSPTLVFNPITYPPHYDCKFIPDRFKSAFKERLNNYAYELRELGACDGFIKSTLDKFKAIDNFVHSSSYNQEAMDKCVEVTKLIDNLRSESFNEIFPYYNNDYNNLNNNNNV